jgi:hypothetical protein
MNNEVLAQFFSEVVRMKNPFDKFLALKDKEKEYKKSDFCKKSRLNIFKAYEWFMSNTLAETIYTANTLVHAETLGEFLTDTLDHISPDAVEDLMKRITSHLNTEELIKASKELGIDLQNFPR